MGARGRRRVCHRRMGWWHMGRRDGRTDAKDVQAWVGRVARLAPKKRFAGGFGVANAMQRGGAATTSCGVRGATPLKLLINR
jgi:hypothetical protein